MKPLPNRERRNLLLALATGALPLGAHAQQDAKLRRVGFLALRARSTQTNPEVSTYDTFAQTMRDLGYFEGRNLHIEWRYAEGRYERLPTLAAELVKLNPEVIVTHSTPATLALQKATRTIPIVVASMGDPVASRVAKSLARPGGNITGLSLSTTDVYYKQLDLLKSLIPKLTRVATLKNPQSPNISRFDASIRDAAGKLGIHLIEVGSRATDLESAFETMKREGAQAVVIQADGVFFGRARQIVDLAIRHRLPSMAYFQEQAAAGALMSYGVNTADYYRRAAVFVDKILKGAKPAELPFELPTKIHLAINQKTAKALGIRVSKEFLFRADEVFE